MKRRAARPSRMRLVGVGVLAAMFVMVTAVSAPGFAMLAGVAADAESSLPLFEAVRDAHRSSDIQVYDRAGIPIGEVRQDYSERRGQWIPLDSISSAMIESVLTSEDRRFHAHAGVDWMAAAAAAAGLVFGEGRRGASTISMQLAAMVDPSLKRSREGRGLAQKWAQMRRALQLEARWSKDEILEAYLNLAAFRGELRGIDALARVMFQKHPHGLSRSEAAVGAALLRGPNASANTVTRRACLLLRESDGATKCPRLEESVRQWAARTDTPAADAPRLASHFSRYVVSRYSIPTNGGSSLYTTLDAALQEGVERSVARHLAGMQATHLTDAAVVVLSNRTGEVLAYVGSSAESTAAEVDHARALRQAGSTLKPFLYAAALEGRYLTAASLLDDAPLDVATPAGLYIPGNYDSSFAGWVSVRVALASSLNIPAVRTLMLLGPERFAQRLRDLGLPLTHDADHYGYSLSLGSADVDLLSLSNAYRSLARGEARATPVRMVRHELVSENPHSAETPPRGETMTALAAWIIGDILSDRHARARSFGLENALSTRFWSAVKTGTSKDMRDNWAVGWSSDYTVGVWVGNSQGLSMQDVSGVTGAAPIWHEVMSLLHRGHTGRRPPPPSSLEHLQVKFEGVLEASRQEYFLPGTAMARVRPAGVQAAASRIVAPADGTVMAIDPDMPAGVQRLVLRAESGETGTPLSWRIGNMTAGNGKIAYWEPVAGRHTIELSDSDGRVLDEVHIVVKGLPRSGRNPNARQVHSDMSRSPDGPPGPEIAASDSD